MSNPIRLSKSLPGATSVVAIKPDGDTSLSWVSVTNGRVVDTDTAVFDTSGDRDAALAKTVALYETNGYERMAA